MISLLHEMKVNLIGNSFDKKEVLDDKSEEFPTSYLILKFAPGVETAALRWLVDKIKSNRDFGGADLLVIRQPGTSPNEGLYLHISATAQRLKEAAAELDLRRPNQKEVLSSSERRFIVHHELCQYIRALPCDSHIPGYPTVTLYHGQSILETMSKFGLLLDIFTLHNKEQLRRLRKIWYCTIFKPQPLEEIRGYFGDSVALYFSFLGFYNTALLLPSLFSIFHIIFNHNDSILPVIATCFYAIWICLFLGFWKRKSNELAYCWGTIKVSSGLDEPRPEFKGEMGIDKVTDRIQPQCPKYKVLLKMYFVSWPVALLSVCVAFYVMLASFWAEQYLLSWGRQEGLSEKMTKSVSLIPSIIYTGLIWLMSRYYRRLATRLTEWENHRTQSQFERHRTLKLVVFEFVNNFMAFFYIAFVYQDLQMLRTQIATMLILLQALNHLQEVFIPFWLLKHARKISRAMRQKKKEKIEDDEANEDAIIKSTIKRRRTRRQDSLMPTPIAESQIFTFIDETLGIGELNHDDPRIIQALEQAEQEHYESTYDDYLELFLQFCYVVLFTLVFPPAALCAVINNVLEMRTDAFKLCRVNQRPIPKRVKNIGAWQRAFEAVGVISVATNCGLLYLTQGLKSHFIALDEENPDMKWSIMLGTFEHLLLTLGLIIYMCIPAQPEWVRVQLARQQYQSLRALRKL